MFLFSPYVTDPKVRYDMGSYFVNFVGFNIIVNLLVLIILICIQAKSKIRLWYKKRQFKQAIKQKLAVAMIKNET